MHNIFSLLESIGIQYQCFDNKLCEGNFKHVMSIFEADADALSFVDKGRSDTQQLLKQTKAKIIIAPLEAQNLSLVFDGQLIVLVDEPKLAFSKVVMQIQKVTQSPGIHPSAVIAPSTVVDKSSQIGANCVIGENCRIGKNTTIYPGVIIYDNVTIGNNVSIHSSSVIGSEGFGYIPDETGYNINFPHIGGVTIENNVVIGAGNTICQGALSNTAIGENTKLDSLVHIAHNVKVGKNCLIAAHAMISGSVTIGDDVWIGPNVSISDGILIEDGASVSIGSTANRSVQPNQKVTGFLAQPHKLFMKKYLTLFKS